MVFSSTDSVAVSPLRRLNGYFLVVEVLLPPLSLASHCFTMVISPFISPAPPVCQLSARCQNDSTDHDPCQNPPVWHDVAPG
jgi:hypothetical protein